MNKHTVQQGETFSSIAQSYGFPSWQSLYDHPDNSSLREKRPNPDVIYPGDTIVIPERVQAITKTETNIKKTFRTKRPKAKLTLNLGPNSGKSWKNRKVRLVLPSIELDADLDEEGNVEFDLPRQIPSTATLLVFSANKTDKPAYTVELEIATLDPLDTNEGIQSRLNSLGYDCGSVDGSIGRKTIRAIESFQLENGLTVNGQCDQDTHSALESFYGC